MKFFSDNDMNIFRKMIEQEFGLTLKTHSDETLMKKLMSRIKTLKLGSLREYLDYLTMHPMAKTEHFNILSIIINTESYFLREFVQLELLLHMIKQNKKMDINGKRITIKILSAGCADGQEPYSISMLLKNMKKEFNLTDIKIYGLDINLNALSRARSGIYTSHSFRGGNMDLIQEYFEEIRKDSFFSTPEKYRLSSEILMSVEFLHANILHPITLIGLKNLDFILCRNVLMYMSQKAIENIVFNFWEALKDDGYLFIGQSESLRGHYKLFEPIYTVGTVAYRKRRG